MSILLISAATMDDRNHTKRRKPSHTVARSRCDDREDLLPIAGEREGEGGEDEREGEAAGFDVPKAEGDRTASEEGWEPAMRVRYCVGGCSKAIVR